MSFFRRQASAALVIFVLFSDGYVVVPWEGIGLFHSNTAPTAQCCCAHQTDDGSCPCCNAKHRSRPASGECRLTASSCSAAVVTLVPNVLDPATPSPCMTGLRCASFLADRFHPMIHALLPGSESDLLHPPQPLFS
ncbi:MAG TPA: hypothetical protein VMG34_03460 [Bacteroidota bacterium]|nr:hypothetical protein [Bacteroidota bacterium]